MKKEDMKVFHGLVNYGTQAGLLAQGLRDEGIDAISVVYDDSYFKRQTDVNITRDVNSKNPILRRIKRLRFLLALFRKYNVFHFYFGTTLLPHNIDAPFYRMFGKKVVMEYLGTDIDLWLGKNGVDGHGRKIDRVKLVKKVYKQARQFDRQLVCAPYYYQFVDNSIILPLALDLSSFTYHSLKWKADRELTFMHCPTNRKQKKSDYIEAALDKLKSEGYRFNYKCVTNVSHDKLKEEYISSDVVIDQLGGWFGTVSIEAMALGRPVVAGYHPHLCHYDQRYEGLPIINADIFTIYQVLKDMLDGKYDLEDISRKSREYVMKIHDLKSVTKQLIEIYESL